MLSQEQIQKIAAIEIRTRRLLRSSLAGDSRSAQKGTGFDFSQIREYQFGDDIRYIDWRGSARADKLLVREYMEERNRSVILALDVSSSMSFSSHELSKMDIMQQVAAALAIVAGLGKDRAGLLLFADEVELFIPPGSGPMHTKKIIEKIFTHQAQGKLTNYMGVCRELLSPKLNQSLVFLISDFIGLESGTWLAGISKKHEVVAVRYLDSLEFELPGVGFVTMKDLESGKPELVDLRGSHAQRVSKRLKQYADERKRILASHKIDCLDIVNENTFIGDIVRFFRRRMAY